MGPGSDQIHQKGKPLCRMRGSDSVGNPKDGPTGPSSARKEAEGVEGDSARFPAHRPAGFELDIIGALETAAPRLRAGNGSTWRRSCGT